MLFDQSFVATRSKLLLQRLSSTKEENDYLVRRKSVKSLGLSQEVIKEGLLIGFTLGKGFSVAICLYMVYVIFVLLFW